jgi:hypothetical protein
MKLVIIERVPRSDKSTLAETLCDAVIASDINVSWFLEESKCHPVHPFNTGKIEKTPTKPIGSDSVILCGPFPSRRVQ